MSNSVEISELIEKAMRKQLGIIDKLQILLEDRLNYSDSDVDFIEKMASALMNSSAVISNLHLDYSEDE